MAGMAGMRYDHGQASPARRWRNRTRIVQFLVLGVFLVAAIASVAFLGNLANSFDDKTQTIPEAFPSETLSAVKPTQGPTDEAPQHSASGQRQQGRCAGFGRIGICLKSALRHHHAGPHSCGPQELTGTRTNGQSIVILDQDAVTAVAQGLTGDSLGNYALAAGPG